MTLEKIRKDKLLEVTRICTEAGLDVAQIDVIERMSLIMFNQAYLLGLDKGWQFEQDRNLEDS
jgi:hypothetical protein